MQYKAHIKEAITILEQILLTKAPADRIISFHFKQNRFIGSKDKATISNLIYETLRNKAFLDFFLKKGGLNKTPRAYILTLLLTKKETLLKDLSELFDNTKYAPNTLTSQEINFVKNIKNIPISSMEEFEILNYPKWSEPFLKETFKRDFKEHLNALNRKADVIIRTNILKISREHLIKELKQENILSEKTKYSPWGLKVIGKANLFGSKAFKKGYFEVQDEGSQILALLADTKPKQRVLDFCCGAGGKLLALGATMENKGSILGTDTNEKRLSESKKRIKRSGLTNASIKVISSENDKYLKRQKEKFDVVFVDAPCSGSGTWRRNPDSKWKLQESFIKEITSVQESILNKASLLVKPGGKLIYATCSIFKDENHKQIEKFICKNPTFAQESINEIYPELTKEKALQLTPYEHGCDGFFISILKKI